MGEKRKGEGTRKNAGAWGEGEPKSRETGQSRKKEKKIRVTHANITDETLCNLTQINLLERKKSGGREGARSSHLGW